MDIISYFCNYLIVESGNKLDSNGLKYYRFFLFEILFCN